MYIAGYGFENMERSTHQPEHTLRTRYYVLISSISRGARGVV